MRMKYSLTFLIFLFFFLHKGQGQVPNCDSLVPTYMVDFTGSNAGTTYISPLISRNGFCCSAVIPERCVDFVLTTDTNTKAITFSYCSYVPNPGIVLYQIDCGAYNTMGDISFITDSGVHYLTFCKPGNLIINYCITSVTDTSQILTGNGKNPAQQTERPVLLQDFDSGNCSLEFDMHTSATLKMELFSVEGKKIIMKSYKFNTGHCRIPLSMNLDSGIYFCRLSGNNSSWNFKFVKR